MSSITAGENVSSSYRGRRQTSGDTPHGMVEIIKRKNKSNNRITYPSSINDSVSLQVDLHHLNKKPVSIKGKESRRSPELVHSKPSGQTIVTQPLNSDFDQILSQHQTPATQVEGQPEPTQHTDIDQQSNLMRVIQSKTSRNPHEYFQARPISQERHSRNNSKISKTRERQNFVQIAPRSKNVSLIATSPMFKDKTADSSPNRQTLAQLLTKPVTPTTQRLHLPADNKFIDQFAMDSSSKPSAALFSNTDSLLRPSTMQNQAGRNHFHTMTNSTDLSKNPTLSQAVRATAKDRIYNKNKEILNELQQQIPIYENPPILSNELPRESNAQMRHQERIQSRNQDRVNAIATNLGAQYVDGVMTEYFQRAKSQHNTLRRVRQLFSRERNTATGGQQRRRVEIAAKQTAKDSLDPSMTGPYTKVDTDATMSMQMRHQSHMMRTVDPRRDNAMTSDSIIGGHFDGNAISTYHESLTARQTGRSPHRDQPTSSRLPERDQKLKQMAVGLPRLLNRQKECMKMIKQKPLQFFSELSNDLLLNHQHFEKCEEKTTPDRISDFHDRFCNLDNQEPTPEEVCLLVQENLEKALNERSQDFPLLDFKQQISEASFIYRRVISLFKHDRVTALTLSSLWTYIAVCVDQVMTVKQAQLDKSKATVDDQVSKLVQTETLKANSKLIQAEQTVAELRDEVASLKKTITHKNELISLKMQQLAESRAMMESLNDPDGLKHFRRMLVAFERDVDKIGHEKETQYNAMKQIVKVMDSMPKLSEIDEDDVHSPHVFSSKIRKKQAQKVAMLEKQLKNAILTIDLMQDYVDQFMKSGANDPDFERRKKEDLVLRKKILEIEEAFSRVLATLPVTEEMRAVFDGEQKVVDLQIMELRKIISEQIMRPVESKVMKQLMLMKQVSNDREERIRKEAIRQAHEKAFKMIDLTGKYTTHMHAQKAQEAVNKAIECLQVSSKKPSESLKAAQDQIVVEMKNLNQPNATGSSMNIQEVKAFLNKALEEERLCEVKDQIKIAIEELDLEMEFIMTLQKTGNKRLLKSLSNIRDSNDQEAVIADLASDLKNRGLGYERFDDDSFKQQNGQMFDQMIKKHMRNVEKGKRMVPKISVDLADEQRKRTGSHSSDYETYIDEDGNEQKRLRADGDIQDSAKMRDRSKRKGSAGRYGSATDSDASAASDAMSANGNHEGRRGKRSSRRGSRQGRKEMLSTSQDLHGSNSGSGGSQASIKRGGDGSLDGSLSARDSQDPTMRLKLISGIKSKVISSLIDAHGAKNKRVIKDSEIMKNPIITAINRTMKIGKNKKLSKDFCIAMHQNKIFDIMDTVMFEKVWLDLENETKENIDDRVPTPFHTFMYDNMIMKFGLQSLAIKNLVQMTNGLKFDGARPYAKHMQKMLGLALPPLRLDEIQIVLRCHMIFKMCQHNWLERMKSMKLTANGTNEINLDNGGMCHIFDLLEEIKVAFKELPDVSEQIMISLKPDILQQPQQNYRQHELQFLVLKITNKIAKIGKDVMWIYKKMDSDGNGSLDAEEIIDGLKIILGVVFSREDAVTLTEYLDRDGSGDVDFEEFASKISLNNLHQKSQEYLISELNFIDNILVAWYNVRKTEHHKIVDMMKSFDDNGDGLLQFDEFRNMMAKLEPNLSDQRMLKLFKTASSAGDEDTLDYIDPDAMANLITYYKLGSYGQEFFGTYLRNRKTKFNAIEKKMGKKK